MKELGNRLWTARALLFLGNIARREGDYDRARSLYFEGNTLINEKRFRLLSWFIGMEALGLLAAAEKQYERAARLFGAVDRIAQELGTTLTPMELVEHEPCVAETKAALGEALYNAAWESGRKLTLDQAGAYALSIYDTGQYPEKPFSRTEVKEVAPNETIRNYRRFEN
jgi:tetratricopeptide (TPR) repeat protein